MDDLIVTIQLALLIVLPLVRLYQRLDVGLGRSVLYVAALYLIWFSTYSLLHESCHLFGSWATGAAIGDYQLVPRFWEGDFKTGYVESALETRVQRFVSPAMPYLRDMAILPAGYLLLTRSARVHPFIRGLVLVLFVLSPLFDVVNNYLPFALGGRNDFYAVSLAIGRAATHAMALAMVSACAWMWWTATSAAPMSPERITSAEPARLERRS